MAEPVQIETYTARKVGGPELIREFQAIQRATATKRREAYGDSIPTVGTWSQGDKVENLAPTELGTPGSQYIVEGWVCVTSGTPGTWRERRTLTGN